MYSLLHQLGWYQAAVSAGDAGVYTCETERERELGRSELDWIVSLWSRVLSLSLFIF